MMLFTGRLTADAEVKELKNDKKVTNFTVALNTKFKTKAGEKKEKTAFVDCAYWVNPGLALYLTKGAIVEINGWVNAEAYLSNKDQTAKSRLVCSVDKIKLFSTATIAAQTGAEPERTQDNITTKKALPMYNAADAVETTGMGGDDEDDDLPF
jgi:single-strand DNA-binding protein